MRSSPDPALILLVDDDDVVRRALDRALTQAGHTVLSAANTAEALRLSDEQPPRLALLDMSLPDGDGAELAKELRARHPRLLLILMTAYPLRLRERPKATSLFQHVLTKPLDLGELRQVLQTTLIEDSMAPSTPSQPAMSIVRHDTLPSRQVLKSVQARPGGPALASGSGEGGRRRFTTFLRTVVSAAVVLLVVGILAVVVLGVPMPWQRAPARAEPPPPPGLGVQRVEGQPNTLLVPRDVREALGIRVGGVDRLALAVKPTKTRPLTMPGSTALDPARLLRIRVRFAPCETVQIAKVGDSNLKTGETEERELRTGDRVQKGQLLAVV
jgi:CheY-like chemotaxis protein